MKFKYLDTKYSLSMHIIQFIAKAWSIFFLAINLTLCYTVSVTSNLQETFSFKEKINNLTYY